MRGDYVRRPDLPVIPTKAVVPLGDLQTVYGVDCARLLPTASASEARNLGLMAVAVNPVKTRVIEFGRCAAVNRKNRGVSRPDTFAFLGFTFICSKSRRGFCAFRSIVITDSVRT